MHKPLSEDCGLYNKWSFKITNHMNDICKTLKCQIKCLFAEINKIYTYFKSYEHMYEDR